MSNIRDEQNLSSSSAYSMAPNVSSLEALPPEPEHLEKLVAPQAAPRRYELVYESILAFGYGHVAALYGLYLACTTATWSTIIFNYILFVFAEIGVMAGAHRLWTHRSYKAKTPLQIILMGMNTLAFQNTATNWVRDHRLHHRYSDTDADPHNASRGFFFSHIGWLLVRKHEEVKRRGKYTYMDDIYANPVLRFQKKYAVPFVCTVCFGLPTFIPIYFFGETLSTAWNIALLRYALNLHVTFLVNSAGHMWGKKPYDKNIKPVQNVPVTMITFGEGFHNYHHTFPWDYRSAELGNNWLNMTTWFIDFFVWVGWAYDLKTAPESMVRTRAARTGDGTDLWGMSEKKDNANSE